MTKAGTQPGQVWTRFAGAAGLGLLFFLITASLYPDAALGAEPTGFLAADGPVPANTRGLYWRSSHETLRKADVEVWRLDGEVATEVEFILMPTRTSLGVAHETIVRPITGWQVGDRYRFVYKRTGHRQTIDVVVDEAAVELGQAAQFVTARTTDPFVVHAPRKGCLSHCPIWETSRISAVLVQFDLGKWARFRSHLVLDVTEADGRRRHELEIKDDAGTRLLYRTCGRANAAIPRRFMLTVLLPAAGGAAKVVLGAIEVPDVCAQGPVVAPHDWPAAVRVVPQPAGDPPAAPVESPEPDAEAP